MNFFASLTLPFYFYPRPPRGGRLVYQASDTSALSKFLSTPSARRATMPRGTTPAPPTNFYPRPPRGGRPAPPGTLP